MKAIFNALCCLSVEYCSFRNWLVDVTDVFTIKISVAR
jgi:hypothetical protein